MKYLNTKFTVTTILLIIILLFSFVGIFYNVLSFYIILYILAIYIAVIIMGSVFIQCNFYIRSVNKIKLNNSGNNQSPKYIALTFDDGPCENTIAILNILQQENIKASFFLIGKKIAGNENLIKRMHLEGHTIGNHTYHHGFNFDWQSAKKMEMEIKMTNEVIHSVTGEKPVFFRPPYGVTNPNLAKAILNTEMQSIGWNVRSMDTITKSKEKLIQKIISSCKGYDIVLLHDSSMTTLHALPKIIHQLKETNFQFVTLKDVIQPSLLQGS